jgi:hypothetical protein
VPGYSGVENNEKADQLANRAPRALLWNYEKGGRRVIDLWSQNKAIMARKCTTGQRHVKRMINKSSNKLKTGLHSLPRKQMRLVVGLLTEQCHLRKYLHRVRIYKEEPVCRKCGKGGETAHNIHFECNALDRNRYSVFGHPGIQLQTIHQEAIQPLLELTKKAGIFNGGLSFYFHWEA